MKITVSPFRVAIVLAAAWMALSLSGCAPTNQEEWTLYSPDGALIITVSNRAETDSAAQEQEAPRQLKYRVSRKTGQEEVEILSWSPLGIVRADADFSSGLTFTGKEQQTVKERYTMSRGKKRLIESEATELTLHFTEPGAQAVDLILRAYNDGIAFRYRFPGEAGEMLSVTNELSGFDLAGEGKAWIQPYDSLTKWTPAYERLFENGIPIGSAAPGQEGWAFPALFEMGNHWVLLSESDLDGTYFGAHLQPQAPGGLYTIRLPEAGEALNQGAREPSASLPWQTPWRALIIGESLAKVVESTLISDLGRPSELSDTSWIRPGRASWSWWSDHESSRSFERMKPFIDLAAEMSWEYSLIDANWNTMPDGTIEELVEYARNKNVGLLLWYNSGGAHNFVEEQPRDRMWDAKLRREEMARLQKLGVKGIKVDFFQSDKPYIIQQYIDILNDAAEFKLLVNFHGCTIPRGWDRTYPHLMAMESVRGAECYSFDSRYPANAPALNTILVATRNVIGPMDYTPVTFSDNVYPHITTNAHELALAVVFESGLLHLADRVQAYLELEEPLSKLLREIPVVWDETRLLQGRPGQEMVLARRSGKNWYIAGINGENQEKEIELDLKVLGVEGSSSLIVQDGQEPRAFALSQNSLVPDQKIKLAPYGGFLVRVAP